MSLSLVAHRSDPAKSLFLLLALALSSTARADFATAPGFSHNTADITQSQVTPAGMSLLPNGNVVVFDGIALVEVDVAAGAVVSTWYQPPSFVFGSFVAVDPGDHSVLFGESSTHDIVRIPTAGGPASVVANLPFNFDCVFAAPGVAFISKGATGWQSTEILRLDVASGATDLVATVSGPSGPLAFNSDGDLFYGVNSIAFPAPPLSGRVVSWSAGQVASAIGPTSLGESESTDRITGLGAVTAMVFDGLNDLILSDSIHGTVIEYDLSLAQPKNSIGSEGTSGYVTSLAFASSSGPGDFHPFQPDGSGRLFVVSSDFVSYTRVESVQPQQAVLTPSPGTSIPVGPFSVEMNAGPPHGTVVLFAAAPIVIPTVTSYLGVNYFFELDPATMIFVAPVALDSNGHFRIDTIHSGAVSGTFHLQGALIQFNGDPLGSTKALSLTLQ